MGAITNVYQLEDMSEEDLASTCLGHGYWALKLCLPLNLRGASSKMWSPYYVCKEESNKISGVIIVAKPGVGQLDLPHQKFFDGSLDAFLDSLETYEQRLKTFLDEQWSTY